MNPLQSNDTLNTGDKPVENDVSAKGPQSTDETPEIAPKGATRKGGRWTPEQKKAAKAVKELVSGDSKDKKDPPLNGDKLKEAIIADDARRMQCVLEYSDSARDLARFMLKMHFVAQNLDVSDEDIASCAGQLASKEYRTGWFYDGKGARCRRMLTLYDALAYTIGGAFNVAEDFIIRMYLENPNFSSIAIAMEILFDTVFRVINGKIVFVITKQPTPENTVNVEESSMDDQRNSVSVRTSDNDESYMGQESGEHVAAS